MGPKARELLARVSPDDLSPEALKFSWTREIDVGFARVRAARMSYVGGPGFELYVPVEMARHVYLALMEAGKALGIRRTRATTRWTRCASSRAGVPGAPNWARTKRRGRPGWRSASSSTSRPTSSARTRCWRRKGSRCARSWSRWCSTHPGLCLGRRGHCARRAAGGRDLVGRLEPAGRRLRGAGLCARRRRQGGACRHAGAASSCGASVWREALRPLATRQILICYCFDS
jgi:hypothetical protein